MQIVRKNHSNSPAYKSDYIYFYRSYGAGESLKFNQCYIHTDDICRFWIEGDYVQPPRFYTYLPGVIIVYKTRRATWKFCNINYPIDVVGCSWEYVDKYPLYNLDNDKLQNYIGY